MSKNETRNQKTHTKKIRRGLSIYKTPSSPYWFARIWISGERKYVVRSTQETTRLIAEEVTEEFLQDLKTKKFVSGVPRKLTFINYAEMLNDEQKRLSGKTKNKRFSRDDERIINRKGDGLNDYFGSYDITSITTTDIRKYLNHLDDIREKPLAPSTKNKHTTVLRKIFRTAYESGVIEKIPLMPKMNIKDNPCPSFTEYEYKLFLKTTREAVSEGVKVRGIQITSEFYYFINFMVHSFLRPIEDEVYGIKHQDITVKDNPKRLEIKVNGKTGFRVAITTNFAPEFYHHMITKIHPNHKPGDYVFFPDYPNRSTALRNVNRQFNYLLEKSNMKITPEGASRSPYALRHYALQTRLRKSKGKVNIYTLAKVAGTSVQQLERFYLKNMEFGDEIAENLQSF